MIAKLILNERELKGAAVYQQPTRSMGILKMAFAWAYLNRAVRMEEVGHAEFVISDLK